MRILVTGGCGFIGSHLVDRLIGDGHTVSVLDDLSSGRREQLHANAELVEGDVDDQALVSRLVADAEAVFHLAAIASVQVCEHEPERAARTNVTGTEHVFAAASVKHIPVVYASSAAVYGDNPALPLAEDAATKPLGNYAQHKLANEATAAQHTSVPSTGLRFFNVYGPRQDAASPYSGVISKFVANAKAGAPLTFFGDGEQTRDFIYVGDVVRLLVSALAHAEKRIVVNGCTGRAVSLKQLAETIGLVTGKTLHVQHAEARAGDIRHSLGSPKLATQELDFTATTSLNEGLAKLVIS